MDAGPDNRSDIRERAANGDHGRNHRRWVLVVLAMTPVVAWMAARLNDACEASGIIW
jgi:hypothetical protein